MNRPASVATARFTSPICLALDAGERHDLERVAEATRASVGVLKIGLTSWLRHGPGFVAHLVRRRPVFLDLKLHDIPVQVSGAVAAAAGMGVTYVTVHALGGRQMISAAAAAAGSGTTILAVTVLTSLSAGDLEQLGVAGPIEDAAARLGEVALEAGAGGLVCSPLEIASLRNRFGAAHDGGPLIVTPGIRASGAVAHDQSRVLDARSAIAQGADLVVVGRPITEHDDPAAAAARLLEEIRR